MEKTFSIIKPNAVNDNNIGNIIAIFEKNGLRIAGMKSWVFTREKAETFYAEHLGQYFYPSLIDFMTSGLVIVLILEGENAVQLSRKLMGATNPEEAEEGTIRKLYSTITRANAIHGSDSPESAQREIAQFFTADEIIERF